MNSTHLAAAQAIIALFWKKTEEGMLFDEAQEFALAETCVMMNLDRAELVAALEAAAA